jgi:hypothetical protein
MMRIGSVAALAFAAVFAAAPAPATARADEASSPEAAKGIRWVEGWEAGRAAAKASGKLMFVYVHRINPG